MFSNSSVKSMFRLTWALRLTDIRQWEPRAVVPHHHHHTAANHLLGSGASQQIAYPYNIFGSPYLSFACPPTCLGRIRGYVLIGNVDNSSGWCRGRKGAGVAAQDKIDTGRQL